MIPRIGVYKIETPAAGDGQRRWLQYRLETDVEYAEPNYMMYAGCIPQ